MRTTFTFKQRRRSCEGWQRIHEFRGFQRERRRDIDIHERGIWCMGFIGKTILLLIGRRKRLDGNQSEWPVDGGRNCKRRKFGKCLEAGGCFSELQSFI